MIIFHKNTAPLQRNNSISLSPLKKIDRFSVYVHSQKPPNLLNLTNNESSGTNSRCFDDISIVQTIENNKTSSNQLFEVSEKFTPNSNMNYNIVDLTRNDSFNKVYYDSVSYSGNETYAKVFEETDKSAVKRKLSEELSHLSEINSYDRPTYHIKLDNAKIPSFNRSSSIKIVSSSINTRFSNTYEIGSDTESQPIDSYVEVAGSRLNKSNDQYIMIDDSKIDTECFVENSYESNNEEKNQCFHISVFNPECFLNYSSNKSNKNESK